MNGLKVAIDYTSAVRQSAGVGRYTRSLTDALVSRLSEDESLLLWYAGRNVAPPTAPFSNGSEHVSVVSIPVSDRLMTLAWQRLRLPIQLERFTGPIDVSHATDFVAPPSQARMISTIHDLSYLIVPEMAHPNLRGYLTSAVPRTLKRAGHVIAVSETTRRDLIDRYGLREDMVTAIPNGVDSWFEPPGPAAVQQAVNHFGLQQPYFITVGTIEPRKNHQTLLHAFEQLHAQHPNASLAVVGRPGWLAEPIIEEIDLATRRLPVRYLRYVDDLWLPALYSGSVGVVYPSWYEGFGLPVLEAMASGTAAVVSDRGALPEVADDAALIVDASSAEEIADAMHRLLIDSELREHLVIAGRERALGYSWDAAAEAHLHLYRQIGSRS